VPGRYARIRALAAFGFAGQYLFSLSWLVGGLVQDGYSFRRQAISELGARTADHPWIVRLGISVWGLSVLAVAAALWLAAEHLPRRRAVRAGAVLLGLAGLCIVLDGFPAPVDCMPDADRACEAREDAGSLSVRHYAHLWLGLAAHPLLVGTAVAVALGFRRHPRLGFLSPLAWLGLLVGLAFVVAFPLSGAGDAGDVGVNQRLQIATFEYPLAFLAAVLFVAPLSDRSQGSPRTFAASKREGS
jgi:cytochrome bd-type quinol oxidase subunit 2